MNFNHLKYLSILMMAGAVPMLSAEESFDPGEVSIYPPARRIVSGSHEVVTVRSTNSGGGEVYYSFDPDFKDQRLWEADPEIGEDKIRMTGTGGRLTLYAKAITEDGDESDVDSATFTIVPGSPWSGAGTEKSPYKIQSYEDIIELSARVSDDKKPERFDKKNFTLMNDIDLNGKTCFPIGTYTEDVTHSFGGTFDGNGLIISGFSDITLWDDTPGAFFGSIGVGGHVKNLGLDGISLRKSASGKKAGFVIDNWGTIEDCFTKGDILVGPNNTAAGFCSRNGATGIIQNCYSTVDIRIFPDCKVAGFVLSALGGKIDHAYYSGVISGDKGDPLTNCFGFVAQNQEGQFSKCYFNEDMSAEQDAAVGKGVSAMTDDEMLDPDFVSILNFLQDGVAFDEDLNGYNYGYPVLIWENDGGLKKLARGDWFFLRNSEFGTVNGVPVKIDGKTKLVTSYDVPFKTGKEKKLSVKLDRKRISDLGAYIQIKQPIRLLNTKLYNQKIRSGLSSRRILFADSGLSQVQQDTVIVSVEVKGAHKTVSTDLDMFLMTIPVVDSQMIILTDTGLKSEKKLLLVSVKYAGDKTKCQLEYLFNGKIKKMNLSAVKKVSESTFDAIKAFESKFPGSKTCVYKLGKKFDTLPAVDFVIDNLNGIDAHQLK